MFNMDFLRRSSLMGTTLRAAPSKSDAFSTNYHSCIALSTSHRCAPPILFWPCPPYNLLPMSCLVLDFLHRSSLMVITLHAVPSKTHTFSTNYHACIAMPTWRRCAPPIMFWPWPPYNLLLSPCLTWIYFVDSHWSSLIGTTFHSAPRKCHAFSTNYYTCIAIPTWHRCAPPILFWPWPPYNLLPRSCLTSMSILTDGYHFACSAQQKSCLFNKLSCMHCNANMM